MRAVRSGTCARIAVLGLALVVVLAETPTGARADGLVTARRALGVAFLGGSVALAKQALDYDEQGDDLYRRYKQAVEEDEIERLYQRTNNRDVKSQVSWALSAAFAISGLRLLLTEGPRQVSSGPSSRRSVEPAPGTDLRLQGRLDAGSVRLDLMRRFF
ncbi:MAG: hypothetical protein AB1505_21255 [Candidatus Latescibacterota bacterium]